MIRWECHSISRQYLCGAKRNFERAAAANQSKLARRGLSSYTVMKQGVRAAPLFGVHVFSSSSDSFTPAARSRQYVTWRDAPVLETRIGWPWSSHTFFCFPCFRLDARGSTSTQFKQNSRISCYSTAVSLFRGPQSKTLVISRSSVSAEINTWTLCRLYIVEKAAPAPGSRISPRFRKRGFVGSGITHCTD